MNDVYSITVFLRTYQTKRHNHLDILGDRVFVKPWHVNEELLNFINSDDFKKHHVIVSEDLMYELENMIDMIHGRKPLLKSEQEIVKIHCIKTFIPP